MEPNKDSSYPEYYPQKEFLNNLQFPGPQPIPKLLIPNNKYKYKFKQN